MLGFRNLRRALVLSLLGVLVLVGVASTEPLRVKPQVAGLFQRVVAKPAARIFKTPGGAVLSKPKPFETFYVFERKQHAGATWFAVGPTSAGSATGWISEAESERLDHLLVLCPTRRDTRERAVMFKDAPSLGKVGQDPQRVENYKKLVGQAKGDSVPAGVGAVGIEPENVADCIDAFSFMPIRSVGSAAVSGIGNSRTFETLSVPLPAKPPQNEDFRHGVVFVIDTSTSMGPYIEQVRNSVAKLSANLRNTPAGKAMSFGVVAFRDSKKAQRTPEYVTKIVHPLEPAFRPAAFDAAVKGLKESPTSNADFREDAVAGMAEALKLEAWDKFQVRTVILVTDAGMRDRADPLSETRLDPATIALEMKNKGIAGVSVFLKTEAGKAEHAMALGQHRAITRSDNIADHVIQVTGGSVAAFGASIDAAMKRAGEAVTADLAQLRARVQSCANNQQLPEIERVLCGLDANTLAMRVEWLGRKQGATPPSVVKGWVTDVSLDSPNAIRMSVAYKPFVLLTRNQMNDLKIALEPLLAVVGEDIDTNTKKMIEIFQTAVINGAVDPALLQGARGSGNRVQVADSQNLGVLLPSYLSVLPLKSPLMTRTVKDWIGVQSRADDKGRVERAVIALDRWMDQRRGWIKLTSGAPASEDLYPVPWEMIP